MSMSARLGCSTITFRHWSLPDALGLISELGFSEVDLGALPGVCDHVPYLLDSRAVSGVVAEVAASGLRVRSVNGDVGDLNVCIDAGQRAVRSEHLDRLLDLAGEVAATALVLPNGALAHDPVDDLPTDIGRVAGELIAAAARAADRGLQLWVESLHLFRLCHNLGLAKNLTDALDGSDVGVVMDLSHVVASGADPAVFVDLFSDRIQHVHLRDAAPGDIHRSIGSGTVDFAASIAALDAAGYTGHFTLELETRDISHEERPAATAKAAAYISPLL